MNFELHEGDCRQVMKPLGDCSVDSIVTDPPYELTANKRGGTGIASLNLNSPAGRSRVTTGFMSHKWDATGAPFDVRTWSECLRVLKPGGYLLAFGGTRTYHRLACAIEDAGFEIRDQLQWLYGSGFPKSLNVARSIDTALCEQVGRHYWDDNALPKGEKAQEGDHICAVTPEGAAHEGEGTALKPAHEPIVLARKWIEGTVAANVMQHGTGGLNIDRCRLDIAADDDIHDKNPHTLGGFGHAGAAIYGDSDGAPAYDFSKGRWPANVIHDGSDEVLSLFPDSDSAGHAPQSRGKGGISTNGHGGQSLLVEQWYDTGSVARFFYCAKASQDDRDEGLSSPNPHPTVKPTPLMRYLCRLVTPRDGLVFDPFCGSGSTGKAAMLEGFHFTGVELDPVYVDLARQRIEFVTKQQRLF